MILWLLVAIRNEFADLNEIGEKIMHLSFLHKIRHNLDHLPDPEIREDLLGIAIASALHQGGWRRSLSEDSAANAVLDNASILATYLPYIKVTSRHRCEKWRTAP